MESNTRYPDTITYNDMVPCWGFRHYTGWPSLSYSDQIRERLSTGDHTLADRHWLP